MFFEKGSKVLFIGDSISDFNRARPVGEGRPESWGTSYVATVGSYLTCMHPEMHLRVVNMGISGNQTRHLVERWQTDVIDQKPDYVSILIGINDVWRQFDVPEIKEKHVSPEEYRENYVKLIEQTLPLVKGMILMTPYIMEPNKADPMRARMDEYTRIVRELAEKYNLVFIDLQEAWDRLFEHMHPMNIAWDRIHPNVIGHMYIAQQFLKAVDAL